jgi:hypothetical protein
VKGGAERRRVDDLALHLDDEFLDLWRPIRDRLRTHPGAVLQIVVGPDVDDVVERPDLGVKEGAERRYLDAFGQRLAKPLLDFRHRPGLQPVGPHLKDHRPHSFFLSCPRTLKQEWPLR